MKLLNAKYLQHRDHAEPVKDDWERSCEKWQKKKQVQILFPKHADLYSFQIHFFNFILTDSRSQTP